MEGRYKYGYTEENVDKNRRIQDRNYFNQMYTKEIKEYLREVRKVLNKEEKESFIYHEYPDYLRLENMVKEIFYRLPLQNKVPGEIKKNMIRILLYNEIYERRNNL